MRNQAWLSWLSDNVKQLSDIGGGMVDIDVDAVYGGLSNIGSAKFSMPNMYYYPVGNIGKDESTPAYIYQQVSKLGINDGRRVYFDIPNLGEVG